MKKIILITSLLTAFSGYSQIKIKAGVNVPSFKSEHTINNSKNDIVDKNNIGFYFGVGYEYILNEKISLDADLLYNTYSYDGKESFLSENKFSSLSLPITVNYYVFDKLKVGVGGSVNNYLKAESIYNSEINNTLPGSSDIEFGNNKLKVYDKINYGIHAGISYNIYSSFFIDVRYNVLLGNMFEKQYENEYNTSLNNLQLGLSYKF